ncbi:50S ribosomal protein L3 [Candidatus Phycorickettsia trachydisci]|uniref:Large ribosomal subunit protein uL3 n=1 Tax=Candidatus Phycorickettsia trachydisci TaxID=2115978 RepID=A0A2P1P8Z8_9RICK|nr:50S ribosomal protein L3 [Candidatus Phycorickettsia trachydisci]
MNAIDLNFSAAAGYVRPALFAKKLGMTSVFSDDSKITPVTLLQILPCGVIQRTKGQEHDRILMGFGQKKEKALKKPIKGIFDKLGVKDYFAQMKEFKVSPSFECKVGGSFAADFFTAGSFVDVTGVSIGKGFAGVMKRWNFRGLEASHGVSISHRSHGSTGQRQDPGKVFKGKKMAGHMGCEKVTLQNLEVLEIIPENNVVVVKGSVPGHVGAEILIRDSKKKS